MILEVLFLMFLIDIVFESSVRLPQTVSFTLSVFAAIVFGQASVEAHFLQPTSLVVLSVSFIFNSVLPISTFAIATRNLRLVVIILGATLGLYGIVLFSLLLLVHICYLRSFGVPYFSPIAPFNKYDQRDTLFRKPMEQMANKQVIITKEESMKQTEVTKREDEK